MNTDETYISTIKFKCLLVLIILAVLSTGISFFHQLYIRNELTTAAVVNVSGRQRMLSQRTAKFSLRLVNCKDIEEREKLRKELLRSIKLLEISHFRLINGDENMNLPGKYSSKVKAIYFHPPANLHKQVQDYITAVRKIALAKESELTPANPHLIYIIDNASSRLLNLLDIVVEQHQLDSEATLSRQKCIEIVLLSTIMIVLLLSWLFIFRPMIYNIKQKLEFIKLLHIAASASNEAKTIEEASHICLKLICENTGWPIGHLYTIDESQKDMLVPSKIWHLEDTKRFESFKKVTEATRFTRGVGLPGRVLLNHKPVWIIDTTDDPDFPRAKSAHNTGIKAGFAFPVLSGKDVVAVMEFFSDKVVKQDKKLLDIMAQVGTKLGRVVERVHASNAIRKIKNGLESTVEQRTKEVLIVNKVLEDEVIIRENAEQLVRKQLNELEAINTELESFTYTASHDMKEPLRTINSYCQLLQKDIGDDISDQAVEDINFITDASRRMNKLIHDLLMLSQTGRAEFRMQAVDLNKCITNAVSDLESQINETGGSVKWDKLPTVQGDAELLSRVLQNLIDNSLKFHGERTPIVNVSTQRSGDMWKIVMEDNGIGFEKSFSEKIFAPFEKLHGSSEYDGSGVGLSICRKTIQLHGGEISAESVPDKGTRFTLTLKAWPANFNKPSKA